MTGSTEVEIQDLRETRAKIAALAVQLDEAAESLREQRENLDEWVADIDARIMELSGDPNEGLFEYLTRFVNAYSFAGMELT